MSVTDLTAAEIIAKFELQVNDLTELSTQEEYDLLNDKMLDVAMERPWEVLKAEATQATNGAITLAANGLYSIAIPSDFSNFSENNQATDNTIDVENNASPKVIFVGVGKQPFQIINYSDRAQYVSMSGTCYADLGAGKIYFPTAPADITVYSFDYIKVPPLMTTGADTPSWMPNRFRKMLWFAMASDNDILQLSKKAASYAPENRGKYEDTLGKMSFWNDNNINY